MRRCLRADTVFLYDVKIFGNLEELQLYGAIVNQQCKCEEETCQSFQILNLEFGRSNLFGREGIRTLVVEKTQMRSKTPALLHLLPLLLTAIKVDTSL